MIIASTATYVEFKAKFDELGGSRKTTILFNLRNDGQTIAAVMAAISPDVALAFRTNVMADFGAVAQDFPQAVEVFLVQFGTLT